MEVRRDGRLSRARRWRPVPDREHLGCGGRGQRDQRADRLHGGRGLGPEWKFVGAGDFLGDGTSEFLIENTSGAVVIGEVVNSAAVYTQVAGLGPEWKFVGDGDFLGDGKDQFLIENTAGSVVIGEVGNNSSAIYTPVAALGPEWKFVGTGDYLGEGHDLPDREHRRRRGHRRLQRRLDPLHPGGRLGSEWTFH